MWDWKTLYSDEHFATKYGVIKGTCGKHCNGCKGDCYVAKNYSSIESGKGTFRPSCRDGHARNTLALNEGGIYYVYESLNGQINRAKNKPAVIRINESGEIQSYVEFTELWCRLASDHPEISFYVYTKNYAAVTKAFERELVPANLTVLISVWHEYGIEEYKALESFDNVKCFAYDDGFDYESHGLTLTTYCKAYDKNGKMDHNITCDKCRKCFNRNANSKCIGCMAH